MSAYTQFQIHPNLFVGVAANATSRPIFAQDFKTIQFSILTDATAAFDVEVIISNQDSLPIPTNVVSATNMYSFASYTDQSDSVNYAAAIPFNPTGTAVSKTFNVDISGARWVWIRIANYSAGTMLLTNAELFSNFN